MEAPKEEYGPPPKFQEVELDPLLEISLTDTSELWLIQFPHQFKPADLNGKELSLKLHRDGEELGSVENSFGKSFDIVSHATQEPDATVIMASSLKSQVVGKISRRVSLVRYELDADELKGARSISRPSLSNLRSLGPVASMKSLTTGNATPSQSSKQRSSQMMSGTSFEAGEGSRHPKRRRVDQTPPSEDSKRFLNRYSQSSGGQEGKSFVSSLGSGSEILHKGKLKKIKVDEQ